MSKKQEKLDFSEWGKTHFPNEIKEQLFREHTHRNLKDSDEIIYTEKSVNKIIDNILKRYKDDKK